MSRLALPAVVAPLWGACLLTLAWIGIDPVALATGRDLGAGFQPAYLSLAAAAVVLGVAGLRGARLEAADARLVRIVLGVAALAVLPSALGLLREPAGGPALGERALRYGKQVVQLGIMLAFLLFAAIWTRGPARWQTTRRLVAAGLALQLAWAGAQALLFGHAPAWFVALERWATSNPAILSGSEELYLGGGFTGVPRVRGTACEPLYLGSFLLLAGPLLLMPGARARDRWLAAGAAVALLLTWSRGAWLAAAGGAAAGAALAWRGGWRPRAPRTVRVAAAVLAGAALLLALVAPEAALLPWRRLLQSFSREDWSNLTRLYSMQAAWRAFLLNPVVGVGWGQYAFHFPSLVDPLGLQSQFLWPVVNNFPLAVLCETGLVGLLAYAVAGALLVRGAWWASRPAPAGPAADARRRVALLGGAGAAIWLQLLTFSQYNLPHLWVAGGLLLAAVREREDGGA